MSHTRALLKQGMARGIVLDERGSKAKGNAKVNWDFPLNRTSEEELKNNEAEKVLAVLRAQEAEYTDKRRRDEVGR